MLRAGIESFAAAFGRLERVEVDGKQLFLALVENPVGFSEVLRILLLEGAARDLLIVINDNLADGAGISWLWDVDFELLQGKVRSVVAAGTRAEDMQLRLRYALVDMERVRLEKDLRRALARGLAKVAPGETLCVLPTYTAMLEVRHMIGDVIVRSDLDGGERTLVGFENHSGRTYLGERDRPLGRAVSRFGNSGFEY